MVGGVVVVVVGVAAPEDGVVATVKARSTQPSLRSAYEAWRSVRSGRRGHATRGSWAGRAPGANPTLGHKIEEGDGDDDEDGEDGGGLSSKRFTCSPMASDAVRPVDRTPAQVNH